MKVETGVIAAAGSGTRMLPVTLGYPKELLPIINKPAIQLIIEEFIESGLKRIIIITGENPGPCGEPTISRRSGARRVQVPR
jgi:UTP--glucose-1-phosphate uridylyltransferase